MIIEKDYGKHEQIPTAEFGKGTIMMAKAKIDGNENETAIFLYNQEPSEIGRVSEEHKGKTTDELGRPKFVLTFQNAKSITALIHSLVELQKEVFKHEDCVNSKTTLP